MGLKCGTEREKPESLKPGMGKAGIFKIRNITVINNLLI
jgi:hypothetical protein